jgi:uncharacterized protein YfbU (UPF0304 family)
MTKLERLSLINQYRILALLDSQNKETYDNYIEILERGYSIYYSDFTDSLSEEATEEQGQFIIDILDLYQVIFDFIKANPGTAVENHPYALFKGFDGNNETKYLSFARFVVLKQGQYPDQLAFRKRNDRLNSHTKMANKYTNMLNKWKEHEESYELLEKDLLEILNA